MVSILKKISAPLRGLAPLAPLNWGGGAFVERRVLVKSNFCPKNFRAFGAISLLFTAIFKLFSMFFTPETVVLTLVFQFLEPLPHPTVVTQLLRPPTYFGHLTVLKIKIHLLQPPWGPGTQPPDYLQKNAEIIVIVKEF